MMIHLTARTVAGLPLLADWDIASALWSFLRRAFPSALAAVLLPNHPHVITDEACPAGARSRFARVLGAVTRLARTKRGAAVPGWQAVPKVETIQDREHLRRLVRYVALNPCRARLARDPLEWPWSTYRDVLGAVVDPWIEADCLARALGGRRQGFAEAFHGYVSGDPSCHVGGTPPPTAPEPSKVARLPLERFLTAAAAATRSLPAAVESRSCTRLLFVHLATRYGWADPQLLAQVCGVTSQSVTRLLRHPAEDLVKAGALCLGDARLCAAWKPLVKRRPPGMWR
jgi:hypothetical protein